MTKTTMMVATLLSLGFGVAPGALARGGATPASPATGTVAERAMPVCAGDEAALTAAEEAAYVSTLRPEAYPASVATVTFAAADAHATASFDCDRAAPFHVRVWKDRAAFPANTPTDGAVAATVLADADGMVRVALPGGMDIDEGELLFVSVRTQQITVGTDTFGSCLEACPSARAELLESVNRGPESVWRSLQEPLTARLAVTMSEPAFAQR